MTSSGRRRSVVAEALCCALTLLLCTSAAGCARQSSTPVARGEYYAAGHPDYDEFFVALYRKQRDVALASNLEASTRSELTHALGAEPSAPAAEIEKRLREKAAELEGRGVRLQLTPVPSGGAALEVQGEPADPDRPIIEALRQTLPRLSQANALGRTQGSELDRMRERSIDLGRRVALTFAAEGAGKQAEVESNLEDARKLLVLMSDRSTAVTQSSSELLTVLGATFRPAPAPKAAEPAPEPDAGSSKKKKKAAKRKARASGSKSKPTGQPARSASAPPSKPAAPPKSAPKPDFEP